MNIFENTIQKNMADFDCVILVLCDDAPFKPGENIKELARVNIYRDWEKSFTAFAIDMAECAEKLEYVYQSHQDGEVQIQIHLRNDMINI